jgi:hypothetical protein
MHSACANRGHCAHACGHRGHCAHACGTSCGGTTRSACTRLLASGATVRMVAAHAQCACIWLVGCWRYALCPDWHHMLWRSSAGLGSSRSRPEPMPHTEHIHSTDWHHMLWLQEQRSGSSCCGPCVIMRTMHGMEGTPEPQTHWSGYGT